jgi:hypothetical protein
VDEASDRTYPNQQEEEFLRLAVNKFLDISEELLSKPSIDAELRFGLILKMMAIYTETLNYVPIKKYLEHIETNRPPGEFTAYKYFEIVRHILLHFNFYSTWNEVCFSKSLITWTGKHSKIDKFLTDYDNHESYKWRIWDNENKKMTYGYQLNFPKGYNSGKTIYLKDLIDENKGIQFSVHLIRQMFYSQIASIEETKVSK